MPFQKFWMQIELEEIKNLTFEERLERLSALIKISYMLKNVTRIVSKIDDRTNK